MDLIQACQQLQYISRQAGNAILQIFDNQSLWGLEIKSDDSPLTAADTLSNQIICDFLEKQYPQIPIISEENAEVDFSIRKNFDYFWLIDPLDGTKEFVARNPDFSVNIALIYQKEVVASAVFLPVSDKMYWASLNNGAFLTEKQNTVRLQTATFSLQQPQLRVARSRMHHNQPTQNFIAQLIEPQEVIIGASLKFLQIAEGNIDLYPRLGSQMKEWDVAANQIIVEEAGGQLIDLQTGEKMRYNNPQLQVNPFLVLGAGEHSAAIQSFTVANNG